MGQFSFGVRLSITFAALLMFSAVIAASFAQRGDAQGNPFEDALAQKADKLLKRGLAATNEDRVNAASGKLRQGTSEVERLSRTVGIERGNNDSVTIDVAVRLKDHNEDELKAHGFSVAARIDNIAT